jgi:hypothetical protein
VFQTAAKAGLHFGTGKWESAAEDALKLVESVTFKVRPPDEVAWALVYLSGANLQNATVAPDQLRVSVGRPATMPDGKPPKTNWRAARTRAPRQKPDRPDSPAQAEEPRPPSGQVPPAAEP